MDGYIALHRKITDNEFYFSEKFTKTQAWIDLLILATHSNNTFYIRGIAVKLKPGEIGCSQLTLAKRWKWNFKTVKKFLSVLKTREMVETKTDNLTTVIFIKNWKEYQVSRNQTVKKRSDNGEQNGDQRETRMETINNVYNVNNKTDEKKFDKQVKFMDDAMIYYTADQVAKVKGHMMPESSDFAFVKSMLKLKINDSYKNDCMNTVRKCWLLLYVIKIHEDKFKNENHYPYFKTVYSNTSYADFKKKIFHSGYSKSVMFETGLNNSYK